MGRGDGKKRVQENARFSLVIIVSKYLFMIELPSTWEGKKLLYPQTLRGFDS